MKIIVLASGSKGNSTLVMGDNINILIDVGVSFPYIERELAKFGISPYDINKVFITHTHSDHVKGLKTFLKKTSLKASVPILMKEEILEVISESFVDYLDDLNYFYGVTVELIPTSHDTDCSVGFVIEENGSSLVYITDTGYINRKYLKRIVDKSVYIIESNHDEAMLMEGPYPYYLKQRVISDAGHLSNKMASKYLSTSVGENTRYIVLAHLSEKNNTEEIAYQTMCNRLEETCFDGAIMIAKQNEALEMIEV